MALSFFNTRSPEQTFDRMVLSTMQPAHPEAFMNSCYGHVCHALRQEENWSPEDRIVLLGIPGKEGVSHGILVRTDGEIAVDIFKEGAIFDGKTYLYKPTQGVAPIEMEVKGTMKLQEFGVNCLKYINNISSPAASSDLTAEYK